MPENPALPVERYLYRVEEDVARRRRRVRCYLVERAVGSNVVARVVFLGAINASRAAVARNSSSRVGDGAGRWRLSPSERHARVLLTPALIRDLLWRGR